MSRPVGGILSTLVRGMGGHPSERSTWGWHPKGCRTSSPCPLFDLAPSGVYPADRVAPVAGALLPHRFTLTCAQPCSRAIGGLFSVALSCGSPRLAVSQHPALWSPDLPRLDPVGQTPSERSSRDHPADSPSCLWSHTGSTEAYCRFNRGVLPAMGRATQEKPCVTWLVIAPF